MPQFTLKELMLAVAMSALGLTFFAIATNRGIADSIRAGLIGGGAMTIGNGLAVPFKKPWLGFAFGFVILIPALILILPPR